MRSEAAPGLSLELEFESSDLEAEPTQAIDLAAFTPVLDEPVQGRHSASYEDEGALAEESTRVVNDAELIEESPGNFPSSPSSVYPSSASGSSESISSYTSPIRAVADASPVFFGSDSIAPEATQMVSEDDLFDAPALTREGQESQASFDEPELYVPDVEPVIFAENGVLPSPNRRLEPVLTRPSIPQRFVLAPSAARAPQNVRGAFPPNYANAGLPFPASPPRPALDPSRIVQAARRI